MKLNSLKRIMEGFALAGLYAAAFVAAWFNSVDQWYLPAGLRFAAMFLLPRRWLPYALLGDVLAMLYIRVPLANQKADDEFPLMWAYVSPFLYAVCLYVSSRVIKRFVDTSDLPRTLPASALLFAVASKGLNVGVNLSLSGPPFGTNLQQFVSAVIGDYLGILLIVLPIGVWQYRHQWFAPIREVTKHVAAMVVLVLCLYASVVATGAHGTAVQLIPLIFMTLPAVYLTVLYGWNGAAIGCLIVNLGISLALPNTGILGAFDGVVLLAQAALCVASVVLLGVGGHITRLSHKFKSAFAELESTNDALSQSRSVAREALFSSENRLRQQALLLAAARSNLDGFRHDVVSTLKANGHSAAAFDATLKGRAAIDEITKYGDELYPFDIEKYGLYAVLMSDNFVNRWGPEARIRHLLVGESPKALQMSQRLAVYRGICAAIDALHHQLHPHDIIAKVRIWKRKGHIGTTVEIRYKGGEGDLARISDLDSIVSAYGGTVKYRRTRGVAFVLNDKEESVEQREQTAFNTPSFRPAQ